MMRPIVLMLGLLALATPALAAFGFPEPRSERMEIIGNIYDQIMVAAIVVFVFTVGWMVVLLVRYRPGGKGRRTNEHHRDNLKAEAAWTIIPLFIVMWVGWIAYGGIVVLDADRSGETMEITVIGKQWKWEVDYGNGVVVGIDPGGAGEVAEDQYFRIPVNETIVAHVRSADVIHALWIQDLGVKIDANPHKPNTVWFEAREPGPYFAQCAEYCGLAHAYMRAGFMAVPQAEFDAWLKDRTMEAVSGGRLVTVTDEGFAPATIVAAGGAPFNYLIYNKGSDTVSAALGNVTTDDIPPGEAAWLNATLAEEEGQELVVGEHRIPILAAKPELVEVDLGEWFVNPNLTELEVGKAYEFKVRNSGRVTHNFYVGTFSPLDVAARTADIGPGAEATILYAPTEGGSFEYWCNISGHYQAGMQRDATVSG